MDDMYILVCFQNQEGQAPYFCLQKKKPGIAIGEAISGVLGKLQPRFCVFGQVGVGSSQFDYCKAAKEILQQNVTDCNTLLPSHDKDHFQ